MKINDTFFQAIKFVLVGGFATALDLAFFNVFIWIIGGSLIAKSISFLISTAVKYGGNKYWTFQKQETNDIYKEIFQFIVITTVALIIDIITFYYATKIFGPQFGLSVRVWAQISVILAALSSAIISFLGYKFLVFRKEYLV